MKEKLKKALVILAGLVVIVNGFVACGNGNGEDAGSQLNGIHPSAAGRPDHFAGKQHCQQRGKYCPDRRGIAGPGGPQRRYLRAAEADGKPNRSDRGGPGPEA